MSCTGSDVSWNISNEISQMKFEIFEIFQGPFFEIFQSIFHCGIFTIIEIYRILFIRTIRDSANYNSSKFLRCAELNKNRSAVNYLMSLMSVT